MNKITYCVCVCVCVCVSPFGLTGYYTTCYTVCVFVWIRAVSTLHRLMGCKLMWVRAKCTYPLISLAHMRAHMTRVYRHT